MRSKQTSLSEKVDAAFPVASVVIERTKQTNTTVLVWEDGQVKQFPSDPLETPTEQQPTRTTA